MRKLLFKAIATSKHLIHSSLLVDFSFAHMVLYSYAYMCVRFFLLLVEFFFLLFSCVAPSTFTACCCCSFLVFLFCLRYMDKTYNDVRHYCTCKIDPIRFIVTMLMVIKTTMIIAAASATVTTTAATSVNISNFVSQNKKIVSIESK